MKKEIWKSQEKEVNLHQNPPKKDGKEGDT